jgi:hypothetical protein
MKAALPNLQAELDVRIHDGSIRKSELLVSIAEQTGIEGFREMDLIESGGLITIEDGVVHTSDMKLGSDTARFLVKGDIGFDETLDLKVKLGFGPTAQRRLLSRGVLLPYKEDDGGWTNIPLLITGNFAEPHVAVDSSVVISTAVNALPDATKRFGKESAEVTRKITDTAADVMPEPAGALLRGAQSATEHVIGGTYGSLETIVKGIARVVTGNARPREDAHRDDDGDKIATTVPDGDKSIGKVNGAINEKQPTKAANEKIPQQVAPQPAAPQPEPSDARGTVEPPVPAP